MAPCYQAFRAPNLAELYRKQISPTQITIPNPDLKPETALGREAGLDWQPADWVQLKGTWYVADYKDFNVPVQISAGPPATRQRLNVSKSQSKGGEAYIALRPVRQLFISGSVNYDDARVVSGPPGTVVGRTSTACRRRSRRSGRRTRTRSSAPGRASGATRATRRRCRARGSSRTRSWTRTCSASSCAASRVRVGREHCGQAVPDQPRWRWRQHADLVRAAEDSPHRTPGVPILNAVSEGGLYMPRQRVARLPPSSLPSAVSL